MNIEMHTIPVQQVEEEEQINFALLILKMFHVLLKKIEVTVQ